MLALLLFTACRPDASLVIAVPAETEPVFDDFVTFLDDDRVSLTTEAPRARRALTLTVSLGEGCAECYRLRQDEHGLQVEAGGLAGAQYGLADALERMGYGFFHPYDTRRPEALALPETPPTGEVAPERARRGLHLHTLHPIEGTAACVMPNDGDECARIIDWLVKNRGNYLGWPILDNILTSEIEQSEWESFTAAQVERAHARGVDVGVGVQLFGKSNLQLAFDLVDGDPGDLDAAAAELDARLPALTGVPWDTVELSFGEFSGVEPEVFLSTVELAWQRIQAAMPGVEVTGVIHVGNYEDLHVTWQGEDTLYYFLVAYADTDIRPWVHSVMYYNLYEDAGGAYLHDEFDQHRAFLEDRLNNGQPVGYFPETAYWIAFDNSVPLYLPLYLRSRWLDLSRLPALDDHVLFSTGWEWGYWQNDVVSLRMSHTLVPWEDAVGDLFPADTAAVVVQLAELQHEALIGQRLAAYLAGRDALIDAGDALGIIAAPDRVTFSELSRASAEDRAAFSTAVLAPLQAHAAAVDALPRPSGDRWADEVADGVDIDALRAAYIASLYDAVVLAADGGDPAAPLDAADALLEDAAAVVGRREAAFHDPQGSRWWAETWDNPTLYDYGYLREAHSLCFWRRERAQVRALLLGEDEPVPACVL